MVYIDFSNPSSGAALVGSVMWTCPIYFRLFEISMLAMDGSLAFFRISISFSRYETVKWNLWKHAALLLEAFALHCQIHTAGLKQAWFAMLWLMFLHWNTLAIRLNLHFMCNYVVIYHLVVQYQQNWALRFQISRVRLILWQICHVRMFWNKAISWSHDLYV